MPRPWDKDRRAATMAKVKKEAARAAARLGADGGAVVIVMYRDGEHLHILDGGSLPAGLDLAQIYRMVLSSHAVVQDSGGEDVKVQ